MRENIEQVADLSLAEKRTLLAELLREKGGKPQVFPLSFPQQRLWFLAQLEPESVAYNMPWSRRIFGLLDVEALRATLNEIVRRHESLRTSFVAVDGQPVQVVSEEMRFELPVIDLRGLAEAERGAEAQRMAGEEAERPFDLSVAPLFRGKLIRMGEEDQILLLTMHHIVSDGWSMGVLYRELTALYEAYSTGKSSPLEELTIQYADFAVWQREWLQGEELEKQLSYWRQQLGGATAALALPVDHLRSPVQSYLGARESVTISKEVTEGLKRLSQREGVTLFMTLLAAFQTLLFRYTGDEDLRIGSPIANRTRAEIEALIGFFVNTLVMRADLSGNPTFRELLGRVKEVALGAYAHQDLPFEMLVEELKPERSMSRNPLFDIVFAMQNAPKDAVEFSGVRIVPWGAEIRRTRFDLEVYTWARGEELECLFIYSRDLFEAPTIKRMMGHFVQLLQGVVEDPEQKVSRYELLNAEERAQLLVEWSQTATEYPREACIHELFEVQVKQTPNAIAVVFEDEQLTYEQLNVRANQLALYLRKRGVGPGALVGICVERTTEMVVGILAILKAGGAYVPLDLTYPKERLAFMLKDSQAAVLLTQERLRKVLPQFEAEVVCLDTGWKEIGGESEENPVSGATAENLAYVIYTSGSTGKPKGVAVPHRAVNRLVLNTNYVNLGPSDRVAQASNSSFDAATFELWGALLQGAQLVGIPKDVALSPQDFAAKIRKQEISAIFLTTALFNQLTSEVPGVFDSVRHLLFGGEAVDPRSVKEVLKNGPPKRLLHVYGPTENTTFSTWYLVQDVPEGATTVPIGRAISNTQIYVLDGHLQLVPIGVAGELYIGGDGLAHGYLNDARMTAEKFVPHPFSEEPGARLYRTGDRVRYLRDGNIEFLGRSDYQVKLRGYRIELEEIEAALEQHPAVEQAVVLAREDTPGDKRLVAYVKQKAESDGTGDSATASEGQADQIAQWQVLYDETYADGRRSTEGVDATFNITGWNSSYTGEAIPAAEMREWVEHTVERILSVKPRRVLEIGCGTGLLLSRVAPGCEYYLGTDFSKVALDDLAQKVEAAGLKQVKLWQREATDFTDITPESFDLVVINSVVQYFPSIEYLVRVLEGAVKAVKEGGAIFIGDVRNHELLEAFHASVELYRAAATRTTEQLRQRVQSQIAEEDELVIAPRFFLALKEHLPQISAVEVMPKRGRTANELTKYRYDVILHVGQPVSSIAVPWLDWQEQGLSISKLRQMLEDRKGKVLGLMKVPNTRVAADTQIMSLMANKETLQTVAELRQAVGRIQGQGLDPEELWELGEQVGYTVEVSWASSGAEGRFDVVFRQPVSSFEEEAGEVRREAVAWPGTEQALVWPWSSYANRPLGRTLFRTLVPKMRSYLQERLPDYMVPAAFVRMEAMPLTPSGKVDRRALPTLDPEYSEAAHLYEAPRTPIEEKLTEIWSSVLQREHIGIRDNFFDLGGHSLLAVRLMSEIERQLGQKIPLVSLFQGATIAHLADILQKDVGTIAWPTLVEIQAGGLTPPLFCVSNPNVNALGYRTLARYLGSDQPVFGLQAQYPEDLDGEYSQAAVDRIATEYLEALRAKWPKGPYQFVGLCRGAHIAYEMARRLEREGEQIALLGILDTWVMENTYSIFFYLEHYAGRLVWLTRQGFRDQLSFLKQKAVSRRKRNPLHEVYFPGPDFVPRTYNGRIAVFRAHQQPRQRIKDVSLGWGRLALGGVDVYHVPGSHTSVLKEPYVQVLAAELKKCLMGSKAETK